MKKATFLVLLPVLLSACTSQYLPTEALRQIKPTCAGGDTAVCSDIGHEIRKERAETGFLVEPE